MTDTADPKPWQRRDARFIPRAMAIGATTFEFGHNHIDALSARRSP
jgi:hypothetical protein